MRYLFSLICGVLFGSGLTVSGMNNPAKVQDFLDITGNWDPTLAFVMFGALAVFSTGYFRWVKPCSTAVCGDPLPDTASKKITLRLVCGAAIFGIGWGLAGICPGPAITLLVAPSLPTVLFFSALIIGLWLGDKATNSLVKESTQKG
ncbi:MAG: DUF6691 family protein [Plesiomonas sp.]